MSRVRKTETKSRRFDLWIFVYYGRDGSDCRIHGRDSEGVIASEFDLDELMEERLSWGLFRDRRPEVYHE